MFSTSKPYSAYDVPFIQGGGYVTLWMVPCLKLVVLCLGEMHKDWDASVIPNIIIDALSVIPVFSVSDSCHRRHAGLDPASRGHTHDWRMKHWTPGQARGDIE